MEGLEFLVAANKERLVPLFESRKAGPGMVGIQSRDPARGSHGGRGDAHEAIAF